MRNFNYAFKLTVIFIGAMVFTYAVSTLAATNHRDDCVGCCDK